jgi:hypothetical protein
MLAQDVFSLPVVFILNHEPRPTYPVVGSVPSLCDLHEDHVNWPRQQVYHEDYNLVLDPVNDRMHVVLVIKKHILFHNFCPDHCRLRVETCVQHYTENTKEIDEYDPVCILFFSVILTGRKQNVNVLDLIFGALHKFNHILVGVLQLRVEKFTKFARQFFPHRVGQMVKF